MAFRRFRDWGVRELVTAWVVYWIAVVLVAAFPQIRDFALLQMSEEHGTVSFSYDGGLLRAALVLCAPPLALWAAWAATRPRRDAG
ncbi:MAG TPA: hypothetical protein VNA89_10955, partial [Gemmatimonadaceae bacterium]|nr:hypothetical protein [Gemmatimonadaceae bacterium]